MDLFDWVNLLHIKLNMYFLTPVFFPDWPGSENIATHVYSCKMHENMHNYVE